MTGIIMTNLGTTVVSPPPPPPPPPPPAECTTQSAYVTGISPSSGTVGSTVYISGYFPVQSFNGARVTNVIFGASGYSTFSATESTITVTVPSLSDGTYSVQVFNGCTPLMSALSFTVSSVSPPSPPPPTPPPTPPPPTPPPPTPPPPSGPCPAGECPWYGTTCTASDAYWTGCAQGSCDIFNSGSTCLLGCSSAFC